jgi:flagellar biosynthesis protein FliQ
MLKSVGLNLFNILSSSSASSVGASSFGCDILSLYLTLNYVISSLIVGTFKSVFKTLLDIYHQTFTIARRTLF